MLSLRDTNLSIPPWSDKPAAVIQGGLTIYNFSGEFSHQLASLFRCPSAQGFFLDSTTVGTY